MEKNNPYGEKSRTALVSMLKAALHKRDRHPNDLFLDRAIFLMIDALLEAGFHLQEWNTSEDVRHETCDISEEFSRTTD